LFIISAYSQAKKMYVSSTLFIKVIEISVLHCLNRFLLLLLAKTV